jgi:beta-N-acetylhexosaminidase
VGGVVALTHHGHRATVTRTGHATAPAATPAAGAGSGGSSPVPPKPPGPKPIAVPSSPTKLLGQRIMVGFSGTSAPQWLLAAVRRGQVGSVILFAANLQSRSQSQAMTGALQKAARAGGNPRLLVSTDQEGGQIKRIGNLPPTLSPPEMVRTGTPSTATTQGRETGTDLRRWGINWDLAPVADVPTFDGAFIWQQGRAFSFNASTVARYAGAFATGLQSRKVAAAAKHFPGLGTAGTDTDFAHLELHPTAAQRAAALKPYQAMIPAGLDSVMAAVAGFDAYDHTGTVAALSRPIITGLLRHKLGFGGVVITDALGSSTGHDETTAGVLAAAAGADVLLYTDSAPGELAALRKGLATGQVTRSDAAASYRRIIALKRKLGLG